MKKLCKWFMEENFSWIAILNIQFFFQGDIKSLMIVYWSHQEAAYEVTGFTLNCLRNSDFWVINENSFCRSIIFEFVMCRRLRGKLVTQRMVDLPEERMQETAPFTCCDLDMFGPFTIKFCRTELKKYNIIFTCLASRAAHLELALDTDPLIQALRRFIAIWGNIRMLRSDNGTNSGTWSRIWDTILDIEKKWKTLFC